MCIMVFILASSGIAGATEQRLKGMGLEANDDRLMDGTYWMIQRDEAYATTVNPSHFTQFKSRANVRPSEDQGFMLVAPTKESRFYIDNQGSPISLGFGYDMGNLDIGMLARYTMTKDGESGMAWDKEKEQIADLVLGATQVLNASSDIDFTIRYRKSIIEFEDATYGKIESDNIGGIFASARYNLALTEIQKLHVYAAAGYNDESLKSKDSDGTGDKKTKNIAIGVSDELALSKNSLAYLGLINNYHMYRNRIPVSTNGKEKQFISKLAFGIEGQLTDYLAGRFGANKEIYKMDKDESLSADINDDGAAQDSDTTIGMTLTVGNFILDWNLNTLLFDNGPEFISGSGASGAGAVPWSTDFSATYVFDIESL